ncbi:MAG: Nif3-like dinuclear metal center hexameric protein [Bacteroidota bacterium]
MPQIKDITNYLEEWAPKSLQESYDNAGLIVGDSSDEAKGALITLDTTEKVLDEAIDLGYNLIIAHHPLLFSGKKRIGTSHWIDKCIRKAIKNDISVYAIHTNLDNIRSGVNHKIAEKLGLEKVRVLRPKAETLSKLTVFVPIENKNQVLSALHHAGAGAIGDYSECSFESTGIGSFKGNQQTNPTIGEPNRLEQVEEAKLEVLLSSHQESKVLAAMISSHPYEEVAYYLQPLKNINQEVGAGIIGYLPKEMESDDFIKYVKKCLELHVVKCTPPLEEKVDKVALCGGSGRFLLEDAIRQNASVFISSDFKYHDYFEADEKIMIMDIGHYESEVFTKELIMDRLAKKFTNFACRLSEVRTNPIKYL